MKLAVFGATGGVGRQVVQQALRAGHSVRALARTPARASLPPAVEIVAGDVLDANAVGDAIGDTDAVLSCLGAKLTATFMRSGRIVAPGTSEIIEAMYWRGVRRLIAISTYGAGDSWPRLTFGARVMMHALLWGELADKNAMEAAIRASHLDWTIVQPVNLKNGAPSGRAAAHASGHIGPNDWIARADVAAFMLAALDDSSTVGRACLLTTAREPGTQS